MAENLTVETERVDDIPLLIAQSERMGVPGLLDECFPTHGNWQGVSLGWTTTIWLAYILSEGDHRLNWAQQWVADRLLTLQTCIGQPVRDLEWSDDRLGIVLDALSDDQRWQQFEATLNQRILRVYDLKPSRVRVDSTTASGYWTVTDDGLFQFGHSKDHRPDLPQLKVMVSALDPLGMPVATQVLSGERADDPLYIPAVKQVHEGLNKQGLLYVGDCKMGALETRSFVQANEDYYLCPLAKIQLPDKVLASYLQPVWAGEQSLTAVYRGHEGEERQLIAEGYEQSFTLTGEVNGETITWEERRLTVRSLQQARSSTAALHTRLSKAQAELEGLNQRRQGKKRHQNSEALLQAADGIIRRHRVKGMLKVTIEEQCQERRVRAYGGRPSSVRIERNLSVQAEVDQDAVEKAIRRFGWRVYATNAPQGKLSLEKAVSAYREAYLIERGFGRLKGKPLSLTPMYLQSDQRATGLVRLLSIGLRILTLIEFRVRQQLAEQGGRLAGLYAGNPKRSTNRPTAEAMLEAFKNINLSVITIGE